MAKQTKATVSNSAPSAERKPGRSISRPNLYAIIVFAFSFIIYTNSIFNDYNMDDELVTRNHRLTSKGISAIPEILTSPYYKDKGGYEYEYRPMVLISFAIEKSFFGEHAGMSHFINVLLYALLCVLLFYMLSRLFKAYNPVFALLIALVFAAHPIHTEVVASIKNRDEMLAFIFGLSALWYAVAYAEEQKIWQLLLVPVFMLLGMLSKATTLTFSMLIPATLILLTTARLSVIIGITTLLLIPSLMFGHLYTVKQVIGVVAAVYAAVVGLYILRNLSTVVENIKNAFSRKGSKEIEETELPSSSDNTVEAIDFSFVEKPLVFIPFVIVSLLAALTSLWGIYMGDAWIVGPSLGILALIYAFGNRGMRLVLALPLSLLAIYMVARFGGRIYPMFEASLIGLLALQLLDKDKRFQLLGLIGTVVYVAVSMLILHHTIFLGLLFFAGIYNRRFLIPSLALMAASVAWAIFLSVKAGSISFKYISYPLLYAMFFLLYTNRQKYLQHIAVLLLPIIGTVYFTMYDVYNSKSAAAVVNYTYTTAGNARVPDITPVNANRVLIYHEWPILPNEAFDVRLGTSLMVLGRYLKLIFMPYPMSYYYGYPYLDKVDMTNFGSIVSLVLHLALLGLAVFYIRRKPILSYGILFYLIAIAPYTGLILPVPGIMGDRFLFIPSLGFAILVVYLLSLLFKNIFSNDGVDLKTLSAPMKYSLLALLLVYSGLTIARNNDWENPVHLFAKDIKVVPNSAQAQYLMGVHLFRAAAAQTDLKQRMELSEQAIEHYKLTTVLYPPFMNPWYDVGNTYTLLGEQYFDLGDRRKSAQYYDSAMVYFENTVRIDTTFTKPYFTMGRLAQSKGDYAKATEYYARYLKTFPDQLDASSNLSYSYFMLKQYDKSVAVSQNFLKRNPNTYEPLVNIGKTYLEQNRLDSAMFYYEAAYNLNRNNGNMVKFLYDLSTRLGDDQKMEYYGRELNRVGGRR